GAVPAPGRGGAAARAGAVRQPRVHRAAGEVLPEHEQAAGERYTVRAVGEGDGVTEEENANPKPTGCNPWAWGNLFLVPKLLFGNAPFRNSCFGLETMSPRNGVTQNAFQNRSLGTRNPWA